jgi:ketosteroid isomerase-like protein
VTERKQAVETFIDGFRTGDRERVLGGLTDDVVWEMPPLFSLSGKRAVADAIAVDTAAQPPDIRLTRLVEDGDVVVAEGTLHARRSLLAGGRTDALFCHVFQFRDDQVCRLVTYRVDRVPKVDPCPCGHARHHPPETFDEARALVSHANSIRTALEEVLIDSGKWMSVLRCRLCGRLWAEDCLSSGMVDLFFVYPIETDDPQGWLDGARPLQT